MLHIETWPSHLSVKMFFFTFGCKCSTFYSFTSFCLALFLRQIHFLYSSRKLHTNCLPLNFFTSTTLALFLGGRGKWGTSLSQLMRRNNNICDDSVLRCVCVNFTWVEGAKCFTLYFIAYYTWPPRNSIHEWKILIHRATSFFYSSLPYFYMQLL